MNKNITFVVTDKNLVVAYRGNKKAYAKPFGGDVFDPEIGKDIAAKKLRLKELQSGIVEANADIALAEKQIKEWTAFLTKTKDRRNRMVSFKEEIVDELHDILNSLNN